MLSDCKWKVVGCEVDVGVDVFTAWQGHRRVGRQEMMAGIDVADDAGADDHWVDVGVVESEDGSEACLKWIPYDGGGDLNTVDGTDAYDDVAFEDGMAVDVIDAGGLTDCVGIDVNIVELIVDDDG